MLLLPEIWAREEHMTKSREEGTGRHYWHEPEARAIITTWHQSGETLAAFARNRGLNRRRLVRWVARLRASEPQMMAFHPVRVTGEATIRGGAACIEIDFGLSRRVRLSPGFAAEDLRRVLTVLAEVPSC
jgi:hypothetical protein